MNIVWNKEKYLKELLRRVDEQVPGYLTTMLINDI